MSMYSTEKRLQSFMSKGQVFLAEVDKKVDKTDKTITQTFKNMVFTKSKIGYVIMFLCFSLTKTECWFIP